AQSHKPATPVAIAQDRLARIDRALQQFVDDNRIAGAVALVLQDGQPVYERAFGWSDKEAGRRMTTDTIFRIASQTKAITSVAVLALVEEGKVGLSTPVSRFIPTFASTKVAVRSDGRIVRAPEGPKGQGHYVDGPRRSFAGGAGLLSTARDYGRFLEMIRNGGTLGGARILAPRTVALMTSNQVGSLHSATGLGFG